MQETVNIMGGLQLRMRTRNYLDAILERVLDISDYFIYRKQVSLSEGFLHWNALSRAIWYSLYGVSGGVIDYVFPDSVWITLFWTLSAAHLLTFFFGHVWPRAVIAFIYAVIWTSLAVLAVMSRSVSPAAPTFAVFAVLSIFLTVRLFREKNGDA